MKELIGGHVGMDVYRTSEGILKVAKDRINTIDLHNEARLLKILEGSGVAPRLYEIRELEILQEDIDGNNLRDATDNNEIVIEDGEKLRRSGVRFLATLRENRIRHGDLTPPNLFVCKDDVIKAVDWQQSHLFYEPFPDRKTSDSYLLWRTLSQMPSKMYPTPDTPRIIRRWMAVMTDMGGSEGVDNLEGKTLLDLGCFLGDFCAMASADGMVVKGIDFGGFNTNFDSIEEGKRLFGYLLFDLEKKNIIDVQASEISNYENIMLFSVWSYLVKDYGLDLASEFLNTIIQNTETLYFENQLFGDGPGPEFATSQTELGKFLKKFGKVKNLAEIPVTGRDAIRSIWRINKHA